MTTFIYVISGEHGRQKIGISDNPQARIKELQTGSPYPLKFEFVGEAENGSAGQIEVEAHFTLSPHKASGGDEWFTVPSDVAITAVMVAAHRLGYRLRPVDPDAIKAFGFSSKQPLWVIIAMSPLFAGCLYWIFAIAGPEATTGKMPLVAFAIEGVVLLGLLKLAQVLIKSIGSQFIATWHTIRTPRA